MTRRDEIRQKALADLQRLEVLMLNGHFDFRNGYHGRVYALNFPLAEYKAPETYATASCPLCASGKPVTTF